METEYWYHKQNLEKRIADLGMRGNEGANIYVSNAKTIVVIFFMSKHNHCFISQEYSKGVKKRYFWKL